MPVIRLSPEMIAKRNAERANYEEALRLSNCAAHLYLNGLLTSRERALVHRRILKKFGINPPPERIENPDA